MEKVKRILIVGLDPTVVDYSKFPGLTPEKVNETLERERTRLIELGYDVNLCLVDLGANVENVLAKVLSETLFDCIVIGAGVRLPPENFLLFEKLVNVVHRYAPNGHICFNTNPSDTVVAVQRWV